MHIRLIYMYSLKYAQVRVAQKQVTEFSRLEGRGYWRSYTPKIPKGLQKANGFS